ncbi:hypothetical protein EHQ27_11335 [Leptospira wolffii]|uniref:Uncharacterized protein n=1 Tax=Leptospira wolffii TaxID=409998 RepID=A0A2M9Z8L5_9LEPT|nr:hypothetical protein [Leptospira wolffii]PJZ64744.1 hypothetical protein CH371_16620 [Leptospira wolffii]TGK56962.1 hypothetical protein EHQ32_15415 [Leptospira wolffii]TGK70995.1 hypothetical protein EHQ27_11335 [Leptospira wolffii]TGK75686.1 hypothetical protein EHQ35_04785 [Leptospira wolffii]TGL32734.1 hypothetical protein EHQ57_01745 [Leptospira wolffii]
MKKAFCISLITAASFSNCLIWFTGGGDTIYGDKAIERLIGPSLYSVQYKTDNNIPFEGGASFMELMAPALMLKNDKFYYKKDVDNCANLIIGFPEESTIKVIGIFCHFD